MLGNAGLVEATVARVMTLSFRPSRVEKQFLLRDEMEKHSDQQPEGATLAPQRYAGMRRRKLGLPNNFLYFYSSVLLCRQIAGINESHRF
jgi:hypothetical protein